MGCSTRREAAASGGDAARRQQQWAAAVAPRWGTTQQQHRRWGCAKAFAMRWTTQRERWGCMLTGGCLSAVSSTRAPCQQLVLAHHSLSSLAVASAEALGAPGLRA